MIELHDIISIHYLKEIQFIPDNLFQNKLIEHMPLPKTRYIVSYQTTSSDSSRIFTCKIYNSDNKYLNWQLYIVGNHAYFKNNNYTAYIPVYVTILHKKPKQPIISPRYITHPCQQIY